VKLSFLNQSTIKIDRVNLLSVKSITSKYFHTRDIRSPRVRGNLCETISFVGKLGTVLITYSVVPMVREISLMRHPLGLGHLIGSGWVSF